MPRINDPYAEPYDFQTDESEFQDSSFVSIRLHLPKYFVASKLNLCFFLIAEIDLGIHIKIIFH